MNWQKFVDDSLLGTGQVAKAAIHGIDGSRYAASAGFVVGFILRSLRAISDKNTQQPTVSFKLVFPLFIAFILITCYNYGFMGMVVDFVLIF